LKEAMGLPNPFPEMFEDVRIMFLLVGALPAVTPSTGEDDALVVGASNIGEIIFPTSRRKASPFPLADAGSHTDAEVDTALMWLVVLRDDSIGIIPLVLCGDVSNID
jgi:hypothetical protein